MLFVKTDNLKPGMRLARPIYNRNGVLLYDRDTKLNIQGIYSIKNFDLIGVYILEPAEPVPPMTEDDREFERFQTISVFSIRSDLKLLSDGRAPKNLYKLAQSIMKSYGGLEKKINFNQDLRSPEDYTYKHSLNVGILVALISKQLKLDFQKQLNVILAALVHDVGKLLISHEILYKEEILTPQEQSFVKKCHLDAEKLLEKEEDLSGVVKKVVGQIHKALGYVGEVPVDYSKGLAIETKILRVADMYDTMTAMRIYKAPISEISTIRYLQSNPDKFDPKVVEALISSINIIPQGLSVELTNGEKGLVITENPKDVFRPIILGFRKNDIYDLGSDSVYKEIQIKDIMKTMDNRFVIDSERLRQFGK